MVLPIVNTVRYNCYMIFVAHIIPHIIIWYSLLTWSPIQNYVRRGCWHNDAHSHYRLYGYDITYIYVVYLHSVVVQYIYIVMIRLSYGIGTTLIHYIGINIDIYIYILHGGMALISYKVALIYYGVL